MRMRYLEDVTTLTFDENKCTGCGRCLDVCPHGVFVREGGKVKIVDKDACIECGACQKNCAFDAVHVQAGVGCAAAILAARGKKKISCGDGGAGGCCG